MRYYSLLVCLLVSLLALPNITIAAATSPTTAPNVSATHTASTVNSTHTHPDWQYQQLFAMHNQLARLDEKLKQQTALGSDVKALESTQQALKVQLANLQTKLEAQEKVQTNQLNGFDGRIGDIASNTNMWGMAFTIFGLIITVAAIALGFSAKNRAVYEAKSAAQIWLHENKERLITETKTELQQVSDELKKRVEKLESEAREIIEDKKKEVEAAADNVLKAIAAKQEIDPDALRVLENSTKRIDKEHATAREYSNLANVSYGHKEYSTALEWLDLAIGALSESDKQTLLYAQLLFNKALTCVKLKDESAELHCYEILIEQFKASTNEAIQEQVAIALYNQGVTFKNKGDFLSALHSYSNLIELFTESEDADIQARVREAKINLKFICSNEVELTKDQILLLAGLGGNYTQIEIALAILNASQRYKRELDAKAALSFYDAFVLSLKNTIKLENRHVVIDSLIFSTELALLFETPEQVLVRIAEVENMSEDSQVLAVMQFIRFLLGDNTINDVVTAIAAIPKETKLKWQFDEIKEYLAANFTGEKQQQIQAVVAFFEQHKDIAQLKAELKK